MFLLKQIVFQTLTKPEPKQKTWPAQNQTKQKTWQSPFGTFNLNKKITQQLINYINF